LDLPAAEIGSLGGSLVYSPDGQRLATAFQREYSRLEHGEWGVVPFARAQWGITFSPDGKSLAVCPSVAATGSGNQDESG
jgi:hypothetical protein